MKVLVIDNYDSFTYNLVQYLGELGAEIRVRRNDQVTVGEVDAMHPAQILISPGPGRPEDAGISMDIIRRFGPTTPILAPGKKDMLTSSRISFSPTALRALVIV